MIPGSEPWFTATDRAAFTTSSCLSALLVGVFATWLPVVVLSLITAVGIVGMGASGVLWCRILLGHDRTTTAVTVITRMRR